MIQQTENYQVIMAAAEFFSNASMYKDVHLNRGAMEAVRHISRFEIDVYAFVMNHFHGEGHPEGVEFIHTQRRYLEMLRPVFTVTMLDENPLSFVQGKLGRIDG